MAFSGWTDENGRERTLSLSRKVNLTVTLFTPKVWLQEM